MKRYTTRPEEWISNFDIHEMRSFFDKSNLKGQEAFRSLKPLGSSEVNFYYNRVDEDNAFPPILGAELLSYEISVGEKRFIAIGGGFRRDGSIFDFEGDVKRVKAAYPAIKNRQQAEAAHLYFLARFYEEEEIDLPGGITSENIANQMELNRENQEWVDKNLVRSREPVAN